MPLARCLHRVGLHNPGAPEEYGNHCRLCYNDRDAALRADRDLAEQSKVAAGGEVLPNVANEGRAGKHVIMCDTKRPPEALDCSSECTQATDTVSSTYTAEARQIQLCRLICLPFRCEDIC